MRAVQHPSRWLEKFLPTGEGSNEVSARSQASTKHVPVRPPPSVTFPHPFALRIVVGGGAKNQTSNRLSQQVLTGHSLARAPLLLKAGEDPTRSQIITEIIMLRSALEGLRRRRGRGVETGRGAVRRRDAHR